MESNWLTKEILNLVWESLLHSWVKTQVWRVAFLLTQMESLLLCLHSAKGEIWEEGVVAKGKDKDILMKTGCIYVMLICGMHTQQRQQQAKQRTLLIIGLANLYTHANWGHCSSPALCRNSMIMFLFTVCTVDAFICNCLGLISQCLAS